MTVDNVIVNPSNLSNFKKINKTEMSILSTETYGFNPGQNLDIKTHLDMTLPEGTEFVITPMRPLLLIGEPFYKGGKLTLRFHNSMIGKSGACIISKGDVVCKLTLVSKL